MEGSSFPIPPKKSPRRAKSSPSEPASGWRTEPVIPLEVKEGDRVLFGKYSGTEIKVDDNEYLILREDEILGILATSGKAAGKK